MNHKTERDEALAKWQRECEGGSVPATPMMRHAYRDGWDDALAGQSAGVPTGYALVPIEPTVEMIAALGFAGDADIAIGHARAFKETVDAYASMIAAAPAPVSAPAPDREQATLCEDGGKCGIGGYCGQCEKVRAASDPEQPKQSVPAPLSAYHEDTGPVVWWTWKDGLWLGEPAWIGMPAYSDWPGYHTHWTYHPEFPLPPLAEQPSAPDYTDCCDTPSLCSSVRRCTAQDAPRARGAACPHGVDDGACKQCYGEATSGEQGAALYRRSTR